MKRNQTITRRRFVKTCAAGALAVPLLAETRLLTGCANGVAPPREKVRYNKYLLKNGSVFTNGRYEPYDVKMEEGVITGLEKEINPADVPSAHVLDCSNRFISPGWVDSHCHIGGMGVDLSLLGPEMGVTALVDAGTYGPETFPDFMERYYRTAAIPVYMFLNVRKNGIQFSNVIFKSVPGVEDVPGARRLTNQYPNIIKGLKVRLDSLNTSGDHPTFLSEITATLGEELQLPVMYHLGNPSPSITDFLKKSKQGDIITHFLRKRNNSIISASGTVRPEVMEARAAGVLFDVGHGVGSFEFDTAKRALDQGVTDFTISSDLWLLPSWFKCRTFANVASKFLALGLSIEDVTGKISSRPREMLRIESEIAINNAIDLTVFSLTEGEFEYNDTGGNALPYHSRIIPEYTLINGDLIQAGGRDKELFLS